jgi:sugar phosphate isomerase/epimerase
MSSYTAYESILELLSAGINHIELSAGRYFDSAAQTLRPFVNDNMAEFTVHNYFPVPREPFTFNLASSNQVIRDKSIEHGKTAIKLASQLGSPYYSFHAGFRIDPNPLQLGGGLGGLTLLDRDQAYANFLSAVSELSAYAELVDVQLLIENNVVTRSNRDAYGEDPLLMTLAEDALMIASSTPANVGILVDVGHLNVSAHTHGRSPRLELQALNEIVKGYHLSDNNGLIDSNDAIRFDSWFINQLVRDLPYYVLEVYRTNVDQLRLQVELLRHILP